jgi:hypothetical protein
LAEAGRETKKSQQGIEKKEKKKNGKKNRLPLLLLQRWPPDSQEHEKPRLLCCRRHGLLALDLSWARQQKRVSNSGSIHAKDREEKTRHRRRGPFVWTGPLSHGSPGRQQLHRKFTSK